MLIDIKEVPGLIKRGDFTLIKAWLNENIHQQGRLYNPDNLSVKVTGEPLNPNIFITLKIVL